MIKLEAKQVPQKIRRMRLERGFTQQALADLIGMTKGYISRIENSDSAPPVGTLISLAKALGVDFNAFFESEEAKIVTTLTPKGQRPVVSKEKSPKIEYAHLAMKFPNRAMEPYVVTTLKSDKLSELLQHRGQELWFVLKGQFEVRVNNKIHIINEGDTLYFDSGYPHQGRCLSKNGELLAVIWNADKA
ncbi:helix-turn-helix domain-containing protein [Desulfocicer niacini]